MEYQQSHHHLHHITSLQYNTLLLKKTLILFFNQSTTRGITNMPQVQWCCPLQTLLYSLATLLLHLSMYHNWNCRSIWLHSTECLIYSLLFICLSLYSWLTPAFSLLLEKNICRVYIYIYTSVVASLGNLSTSSLRIQSLASFQSVTLNRWVLLSPQLGKWLQTIGYEW